MPYRDTYGIWHIKLVGRDYSRSMEKLPEILRNHEPFITNGLNFRSLSRAEYKGAFPAGLLPDKYHLALEFATYVVYSWKTPVAWYIPQRLDGGPGNEPEWHIPDENYGARTTRHQNIIRAALGNSGEGFVINP